MRVAYIAAASRSGSTLLGLLLGRHPDATSLGEVHKLTQAPYEKRCGCGAVIASCPFWTQVSTKLAEERGLDPDSWLREHPTEVKPPRGGLVTPFRVALVLGSRRVLRTLQAFSSETQDQVRAALDTWAVFEAVAHLTNTSFMVDSSKEGTRLKLLYLLAPSRVKVVHLVRDGRAVAASRHRRALRHGKQLSLADTARNWRRENRAIECAMATIPRTRKYRLRYEDLCDDPTGELSSLCDFLGFEYRASMLAFRRSEQHQIPGSPMLFRSDETRIVKDEKWRNRLNLGDLESFDRVAGKYNRRYGYTD